MVLSILLKSQRIFETSKGLETIERYYLKPPFKLDEAEKKQQQFGNIILSSTLVNKKYVDFQCLCHFFVDRQYTEVEPIQYLFEALQEFDNSERAEFIRFVTGSSKVPIEGFKGLRGQNGIQKFTVVRIPGTLQTRLPQSHTCHN